MSVAELIHHLSQFPPDREVVIYRENARDAEDEKRTFTRLEVISVERDSHESKSGAASVGVRNSYRGRVELHVTEQEADCL